MSNCNATIWMNVTTSANWKRPPVGIVRVETSLCRELSKLYGYRFKQCIWDGDRFVEFKALEKELSYEGRLHLEQNTIKRASKNQILPLMFPILSKRKALAVFSSRFFIFSPKKNTACYK
jgi:hypothetical protein